MPRLSKRGNQLVIDGYSLSIANNMLLDTGESLEVDVKLIDKRMITDQQRKFIFALCSEIAFYTGDEAEWTRLLLQEYNSRLREIEVESLSNCDMTYANGLIDTIINFCIEKEIPFAKSLIKDNEYHFDEKQTYAMCLKRVCVICGSRAELHHVDAIGMGNNRNKVSHLGKRMLPLCRECHVKIHTQGDKDFIEENHLSPITI
ncbi:hypothetical protein LJC02_02900, partial [Breznakia sp. OttesenSCG-928-G09]|nr:hypothetical protein [Breznakia sp. OttesenSCG-928-G09]